MVVGRGRVGRSLARAARSAGLTVRLVRGRGEGALVEAPLVFLCVPDVALARVAERLRDARVPSVVVHTAGVLPTDHLAALRARGWQVGQAHPLVAVATPRAELTGATLLVGGDPLAVRRVGAVARRIGMRTLAAPGLDRALWHAVAALVANGASTLAAHGAAALVRAGLDPRASEAALGGLLASVARNVSEVGLPAALTGPVRRGDAGAVERHVAALSALAAGPAVPPVDVVRLYATLVGAQIELARAIGEAGEADLERIGQIAARASARRRVGRPRRGRSR